MMRAYSDLLVQTCHRRGAFAIGGMAAFIPSRARRRGQRAAFAKVREDKKREAGAGFDGSWVAHPDLVPVCAEIFDGVLGERPNQVDRLRDDVRVTAADLLAVDATPGERTEDGLRGNVDVGIAVPRGLARRQRRGRDRQPDGGRRHRRDLPLAGLAVDPQRRHAVDTGETVTARARRADRRPRSYAALRDGRLVRRRSLDRPRAGCSSSPPSTTSSPTSSPCRRTPRCSPRANEVDRDR